MNPRALAMLEVGVSRYLIAWEGDNNETCMVLEPVIRMSHENISVVNFDCRFAPNFEFCFNFKKCMTVCSKQMADTQLEPCETKQKYVNKKK